MSRAVERAYALARDRYAEYGVDADRAVKAALAVPISMHCWQADDVAGFETKPGGLDGGGIMATGNYPGRARNGDEARRDYETAMALIPGAVRLNVHACYAETGSRVVDRDALEPEHFARWMAWAKSRRIALDFNPTCFAHPKAQDGFTLSHRDRSIRNFWVRHVIACRRIAEAMARAQGCPCIINHWMPDGMKDIPSDRWTCRALLEDSLDRAIVREKSVNKKLCRDFVESKLFGIGSEEYVVGSSEFYSNYALSRGIGLCMDMGHYHPTETIHDKISGHLRFHRALLLHVSRPIRWDSDHVCIFNDDIRNVFLEIQRGAAWDRVAVATDFFDASINRIAAYAIGLRATRQAILFALLDPTAELQRLEAEGRHAQKLALMEAAKALPFGAVWDSLCETAGAPVGNRWVPGVEAYERDVLALRR